MVSYLSWEIPCKLNAIKQNNKTENCVATHNLCISDWEVYTPRRATTHSFLCLVPMNCEIDAGPSETTPRSANHSQLTTALQSSSHETPSSRRHPLCSRRRRSPRTICPVDYSHRANLGLRHSRP